MFRMVGMTTNRLRRKKRIAARSGRLVLIFICLCYLFTDINLVFSSARYPKHHPSLLPSARSRRLQRLRRPRRSSKRTKTKTRFLLLCRSMKVYSYSSKDSQELYMLAPTSYSYPWTSRFHRYSTYYFRCYLVCCTPFLHFCHCACPLLCA